MANTYTTVQGDMWDSIAYRLYGDEGGMNALIAANPSYIDVMVFPAGVVLAVPNYIKPTANTLPPWRR